MDKTNGKATIGQVYERVDVVEQRLLSRITTLEDKIDGLTLQVGRMTGYAAGVGGAAGLAAWFILHFIK